MGHPLTERELAVLLAVTRPGSSRRKAAQELGISPYTVDTYLRNVYLRLGVNSAAQAIAVITRFSDLADPRD